MAEILYSIAHNSAGELIHIKNIKENDSYFCCECKAEMVPKRGPQRQFHFAHKGLADCIGEGDRHFLFKDKLYRRLDQALKINSPLRMYTWRCQFCNFHNTGNLLKNIVFVDVEYNMGICRPDIALLDVDRRVRTVIEVVVSHWPTDDVLRFYKRNRITEVIFDLGYYKEMREPFLDEDILKIADADILPEQSIEFYDNAFFAPKRTRRLTCKNCGCCTDLYFKDNMKRMGIKMPERLNRTIGVDISRQEYQNIVNDMIHEAVKKKQSIS